MEIIRDTWLVKLSRTTRIGEVRKSSPRRTWEQKDRGSSDKDRKCTAKRLVKFQGEIELLGSVSRIQGLDNTNTVQEAKKIRS